MRFDGHGDLVTAPASAYAVDAAAATGPLAGGSAIPVMRPQLPNAAKLGPYLERIDASRYYSNFGPLLREFESRLAAHFRVDPDELAVLANGTVALSAALLAAGARPGRTCLLPSWTFVASAAAVWAANLTPHFVDVSEQTWMLDPDVLRRRSDLATIGAVMVVSAFGVPVDTCAWDAFAADTGIPVIIDGAGAFDAFASVERARPRRAPVMISLHATKAFGIGEGGIVISRDRALIHAVRKIGNFGVWGEPEGQVLGYNGKLSEYHAAVGLAMLEEWPQRRHQLAKLTRTYAEELAKLPGVSPLPTFGDGWVSCYANVDAACGATAIIEHLTRAGIETRRWWRTGVHGQSAYASFPRDPLPTTERLIGHVVGLPFFHDIAATGIERVFDALRSALHSSIDGA